METFNSFQILFEIATHVVDQDIMAGTVNLVKLIMNEDKKTYPVFEVILYVILYRSPLTKPTLLNFLSAFC